MSKSMTYAMQNTRTMMSSKHFCRKVGFFRFKLNMIKTDMETEQRIRNVCQQLAARKEELQLDTMFESKIVLLYLSFKHMKVKSNFDSVQSLHHVADDVGDSNQ